MIAGEGSDRTGRGRVQYGLDAPGVVVGVLVAGVISLVAGLTVLRLALLPAIALLAYVGIHVWVSARGKIRVARRLLAGVQWEGNESVLDVGCGHGLLLIEAARQLPHGRAVGVDIWSQKDQWHNSAEAVVENIGRAELPARIFVQSADARSLPFPDHTFDVVVSSLVIHNIANSAERDRAIREMVRVLKPAGHLAVVDLAHTNRYASVLRDAGMIDVRRSAPLPLFLPTARSLTARR